MKKVKTFIKKHGKEILIGGTLFNRRSYSRIFRLGNQLCESQRTFRKSTKG